MDLDNLLTGSYNSGLNTYNQIGVWMIISVVVAIIGGITLYFAVFTKQNEKKFTGFLKWCHDFFTFKKMMLETILKILYIIIALYITLSSFSLISISFVGFLAQLILGNVIARLSFELSLILLTICKNTTEINSKMKESKKDKEEK